MMINKMVFSLLLVVPLGCAREPINTSSNSTEPGKQMPLVVPSQVSLVETTESRDRTQIKIRAKELFDAKNYKALERLAEKYRSSKECYADGMWKLTEVYNGINLSQEAVDSEWKDHLALLRDWIAARPDSVTARVALADGLITYAWKARGSGSARTVTSEGWKLMGERLTEAVQVLKDSTSLREKCPRQWSLLMSAGLGLGVSRPAYEAIFQKAAHSEPGYTAFQCNMAYYLMDRWYGKKGELGAFITKCADDVGGDDGDLLYARLAWYLQSVSDNIFDEANLSWERVDKGFAVMEDRFPDSAYAQNGRAYMALLGSTKIQPPRFLVAGLNGRIDPKVWRTKENFIRMTKDL